jgi:hypothetical protein
MELRYVDLQNGLPLEYMAMMRTVNGTELIVQEDSKVVVRDAGYAAHKKLTGARNLSGFGSDIPDSDSVLRTVQYSVKLGRDLRLD